MVRSPYAGLHVSLTPLMPHACMHAGALFRAYPGPWQVLRRDREGLRVVHTQDTMPSLKEVALEILPRHP